MLSDAFLQQLNPQSMTQTDEAIPRPEYPRPSAARAMWLNLNGTWQFEIDQGDSGMERGLVERELSGTITVPFAPESIRSGIGNVDFLECVWYRRQVHVPEQWGNLDSDVHIIVHFEAVDYETQVWANGIPVARHRGGFTPFSADLHGVVRPGESVTLVVRARDYRHGVQPRGKQSREYANGGCFYTRTTGIWQTVWMEPVPSVHVKRPFIRPDVANHSFQVVVPISSNRHGYTIDAHLCDESGEVTAAHVRADSDLEPTLTLTVPEDRVRLWSPQDPNLYGLTIVLRDTNHKPIDTQLSYAGLRSITIDGKSLKINGKPIFQRLVLDQGFWPDTLMTAPSDAALVRDIKLGQNAGFNGARLHQKVFEERYLYHADRLGYLVWAEFPDWGADTQTQDGNNQRPNASFITQWIEELLRDRSHPAIIGWCPLNETQQTLTDNLTILDDVTRGMFLAAKSVDGTRPVIDASGYSHRQIDTDVWDAHLYEQDPTVFANLINAIDDGEPYTNRGTNNAQWSLPYRGQPYWISEFGGIWWDKDATDTADGSDGTKSWGYGQRVHNEAELQWRFSNLTRVLLQNPHIFGYCYTQLTDVFQEQNGIYAFDRTTKLDINQMRKAQEIGAAVEEHDIPNNQ